MLSSTAEPRLLFFQAWDFWWNLQDACRLSDLNLSQQPTSQHSGMTRKKCIQLPIFEPVAHGFVHVWCLSLYFLSASFHHLSDNHTFSKLETKLIACSSNHTIEELKWLGLSPNQIEFVPSWPVVLETYMQIFEAVRLMYGFFTLFSQRCSQVKVRAQKIAHQYTNTNCSYVV